MRTGETSEVRCKQPFIGCHSGDDVVIRMSLQAHVKLFTCPDCNGEVEVRVERDPSDQRGPNEESTCGCATRCALRDETMRGGRKPISASATGENGENGYAGWHGPRLGGLLGAQGDVIETAGSPGKERTKAASSSSCRAPRRSVAAVHRQGGAADAQRRQGVGELYRALRVRLG